MSEDKEMFDTADEIYFDEMETAGGAHHLVDPQLFPVQDFAALVALDPQVVGDLFPLLGLEPRLDFSEPLHRFYTLPDGEPYCSCAMPAGPPSDCRSMTRASSPVSL